MDKNTRINEFKFWCQKVLPLVYDDSLSYYEVLCKIKNSLKELIQNFNEIPGYIIDLIEEYLKSDNIKDIISELLLDYILNVKYPPKGITPAVGDGSADDTETIQACIDYAYDNGGMAVYLPSGKYLTGTLTLKDEVSLFGFDRYSSHLILKGGSQNSLLSCKCDNISISRLTLNSNIGVQVNPIDTVSSSGSNHLYTDLVILNGSSLMVLNSLAYMQLDNIVFDKAVYTCMSVSGNNVQGNNLYFKNLNESMANQVIAASCNNSTFYFNSICTNNTGIDCSGSNNNFIGTLSNPVPFNDSGNNNNYNIYGVNYRNKVTGDYNQDVGESYSFNAKNSQNNVEETMGLSASTMDISGGQQLNLTGNVYNLNVSTDSTINVAQNETKLVEGNKKLNVTGNDTQSIGGYKEVNAQSIHHYAREDNRIDGNNVILNPTEPLTYERFSEDKVKMKDSNGEYYLASYTESSYSTHFTDSMDFDIEFLTSNTFSVNSKSSMSAQGSAFDGSNLYYVVTRTDNDNTLIKIDVNGVAINSANLQLGHANGMCWIKTLNQLAVVTSNNKGVILINPFTLAITNTKLSGETFTAIAYDEINDKIATRYGSNIYIYDTNFSQLETFVMNEPRSFKDDVGNSSYNSTARQDIGYYDGLVYNMYWKPNCIVAYDNTGTVVKVYNIRGSYNSQYTGEPESLNFVNGVCYINTNNYDDAGNYHKTNFYTFTPFQNAVTNGNPGLSYTASPFASLTVYVDATNTKNYQNGTMYSPFSTLQEAFIACEKSDIKGKFTIIIMNESPLGGVWLQGLTKSYEVNVNTSGQKAQIGSLWINLCSMLTFKNCNFGYAGALTDSLTNTVLVTNSPYVDFRNSTFNSIGFATTLEVRRTKLSLENCIWNGDNVTNNIIATNESFVTLYKPTYNNSAKCISKNNSVLYVGGNFRTSRIVSDNGFVFPTILNSGLYNTTLNIGYANKINLENMGENNINSKNNMVTFGIQYDDNIYPFTASFNNTNILFYNCFNPISFKTLSGRITFDFTASTVTFNTAYETSFNTAPPTSTNPKSIYLKYMYFYLV